jgi:hypothetical protein
LAIRQIAGTAITGNTFNIEFILPTGSTSAVLQRVYRLASAKSGRSFSEKESIRSVWPYELPAENLAKIIGILFLGKAINPILIVLAPDRFVDGADIAIFAEF